jgi:O-methyltransferase
VGTDYFVLFWPGIAKKYVDILYNICVDIEQLLRKNPPHNDQIAPAELKVILRELVRVLNAEIPGDVVELGCYQGATSLYLARILQEYNALSFADLIGESAKRTKLNSPDEPANDYNNFYSKKRLYLYDSFAGLPEPAKPDFSRVGEEFQAGELLASKAQLLHDFQHAGLSRPFVKKAWFSDLTDRDLPSQIVFAFFDGDFYDSIKDSFRVCNDKFAPGATVIIDDYDNEKLPGVAQACHEWCRAHADQIAHAQIEQSLLILHLH